MDSSSVTQLRTHTTTTAQFGRGELIRIVDRKLDLRLRTYHVVAVLSRSEAIEAINADVELRQTRAALFVSTAARADGIPRLRMLYRALMQLRGSADAVAELCAIGGERHASVMLARDLEAAERAVLDTMKEIRFSVVIAEGSQGSPDEQRALRSMVADALISLGFAVVDADVSAVTLRAKLAFVENSVGPLFFAHAETTLTASVSAETYFDIQLGRAQGTKAGDITTQRARDKSMSALRGHLVAALRRGIYGTPDDEPQTKG